MAKQNKNLLSGSPRITKVSFLGRVASVFQQHFQQVFSSFSELWKTPFATFMTILVLGVALSLPSVFHVLYKNTVHVTDQWDKASEISLFLNKDISEPRIQVLINKLELYSDIDSVSYISSHQALEEFKEMSGFSKALNYLDENPLPDVLIVVPVEQAMNAAGSKLLVAKLKREQGVELVRVDIDWIEKLQAILSVVVDIVIAIVILLLLSVLLIVSNTIRLNILNQRAEIEVFKLVGATNSFIQRPFLYAGAWYGFLGGVIAWLLTFGLVLSLRSGVNNLMGLYQTQFQISAMSIEEVAILIATATFLGFIASYISVKQYLVKIEPK
ncbi:permease-like cell division protein FtsX [Psychromonas antarctica]|jgi:cell division transport system permease protein|uniref:permease-like cell division protein FtsX n=1 Tax=Psychromonas antarctica TaxID=67573 RepID=UPI001EE9208E|nr:permease-like cell division protein FtsX [Psychromonas antarctica]MCG6200151.1 permease-like cell division protein FtsX [Psychromonas antarctica]